jgi:DNA-binding MarR family transcriptional regulator
VAKKPADDLLNILSAVMIGLVADDSPDLTMRGLSILLMTRTLPGPHTVRGFAERLGTSKPAITRTADRLEQLGLVQRVDDPADGRSVLVRATKAGAAHVTHVGRLAWDATG